MYVEATGVVVDSWLKVESEVGRAEVGVGDLEWVESYDLNCPTSTQVDASPST